MAKKKSRYYQRLNEDLRSVNAKQSVLIAERNIMRCERDNARKSVDATNKKIEKAYAEIARREAELRENEAMSADERTRMKFESMRARYIDLKKELRRYRKVIAEIQRLKNANWENSDEGNDVLLVGRVQAYQNALDMFKEAGWAEEVDR